MKVYFPTPAYVLVAYGLIYLVLSSITFDLGYVDDYRAWLLLSAPPVTACEALVYWQIRKENRDPKSSWTHVWLLILGYTIAALPYISITWPRHPMRVPHFLRRAGGLRDFFCFAMIVVAHIFFVIVRRKAAAEPPPDEPQSDNLLDDIAS